MNNSTLSPPDIAKAYARIKPYIHKTPLLHSNILNEMHNCKIYFKMDALQKTGAFKIRSVLNHLLELQERGQLPNKIVAYSTGNHALAMSYAAKLFGICARVYLPQNVSPIKKQIAVEYGAQVVEVATRAKAEELARKDGNLDFYYLHPSDNDETIAGAGTLCYEALLELEEMGEKTDAIFGSCGGGGLLAGSYLAKELIRPTAEIHGVEPAIANDAYLSLSAQNISNGKIFRFTDSPPTIADGLRTLGVSARTLQYLKKLDGFHLVSEEAILYWTAWLIQMMKITCEPSAAISMAAAHAWLQNKCLQGDPQGEDNSANMGANNKVILILITGGNLDPEFYHELSNLDLLLPK